MSVSTRSILAALFVVALLVPCPAAGQDIRDDWFNQEMLRPLREAGYSLDDVGALVQLMETNHRHLAVNAAFALSRLPKSEDAMRGLRQAANSPDETLATYAMRALLKFDDKTWVPAGQALLGKAKFRALNMQLAGLLAQAGCYDGWPLIQRAMTQPRTQGGMASVACYEVRHFAGMKDEAGNPVDLAAEMRKLLPRAVSDNKKWIVLAIDSVTPPRPRPTPPALK